MAMEFKQRILKSVFIFSNLLLNGLVLQNGLIKNHAKEKFFDIRMIWDFTYLNSTYSCIL